MIKAPETISTTRLLMRRPIASDAEAIFEYASDPEVTRFMDWPTRKAIHGAVEFLAERESRWESGEEFCWVITVKPKTRAVGAIACRVRDTDADFGYVLNRNFWRQGYATEAAEALLAWLMRLPSIGRVWATCDYENIRSARVLEKIGLSLEGTLPEGVVRPNLSNAPRDTLIFSKTRTSTA
jgi:[ribosomal protein S5]-alanine N-acetyltransferase